jgi:hypothetical protein
MQLRRAIEFAPREARLRPDAALRRIDPDALHRAEVDHQPAVADCTTRDIMATAAHGDFEAGRDTEPQRIHNIRRSRALGDEGGPLVNHAVVDTAHIVVGRISGSEQRTGKAVPQSGEAIFVDLNVGRHYELLSRRVPSRVNPISPHGDCLQCMI